MYQKYLKFKLFRPLALAGYALAAIHLIAPAAVYARQPGPAVTPTGAAASPPSVPASGLAGADALSVTSWLMRLHEASKERSYIGTYVVSSGGMMSSAKIWHVCSGEQQVERIEALSGAPRSVFRHNDRMLTFMPDDKVVRIEQQASLGIFSELLQSADGRIADFYDARSLGSERVAGLDADIVVLDPKDAWRFGYKIWTEKKQGLVLKLQTLDAQGQVLEQAAFSELQLDAPVRADKLLSMMGKLDGYQVQTPVLLKTTASAEGWALKTSVPGFKSMGCYKRPVQAGTDAATLKAAPGQVPMQWIFSDGLASVSVFVEPMSLQSQHTRVALSMGATQTLASQVGAHWVTLVGEVPMATLQRLAAGLEHKK